MNTKDKGRRQFIKAAALGAIGAGLAGSRALAGGLVGPKTGQTQEAPADRPRIIEYRTLGRTGFKVSDLGCGSIQEEGVLRAAFDAGMNYVDSAEQYPGHHRTVGRAIKGLDRKTIFISTKLEVLEDKSKERFLKRARKSLEELQIDYIDCLMMHMPEKAETLKTEGFHEAMRELKAEGRVKFVGVSNHGSFWFRDPEETMEKVLLAAAEDGRFDVFLMAYNFLRRDQAERVLEVCGEKKIGVALMKATPIAIYESLKSRVEELEKKGKDVNPLYADGVKRYKEKFDAAQEFIRTHNLRNAEEIKDAAIRFVLGNPNVHTVCCLVKTYAELETYLRLSGTRLTTADRTRLETYAEGCGELYCRHACGECEVSCPHGVPVNTIMRYQRYFAGQGREKEAMGYYAAIPGARADVCASCPAPCERTCPYGVPIHGMLLLAHDTLSMPD
ncbi:MAG: aldo/keto reductase [Candidatus Aminicenantes bacterium]|nr:aldo/keto reductase [Candidatus Aminicenantes bacterium]